MPTSSPLRRIAAEIVSEIVEGDPFVTPMSYVGSEPALKLGGPNVRRRAILDRCVSSAGRATVRAQAVASTSAESILASTAGLSIRSLNSRADSSALTSPDAARWRNARTSISLIPVRAASDSRSLIQRSVSGKW